MATGVLTNTLPEHLTSFVGRRQEREEALGALAGTRLLVLTGPGGCGKTRLAVEVAAAAEESFPDGLWWVDLTPLVDGDQVAGALARVLDVQPLPGRTQTQAAVMRLADERSLVILDNCEHVSDGAADLCEALLRGGPRVVVLATSRSPLRVPGESDWQVPPLSLPATDTPGEIARSDAGALFVERSAKVRPGFALDDENAAAVARICRNVDGLPLAIELASARVRMLSPEQIADGLRHRFRLLTGGQRGVLARQQTLRASVDWSYELLSEPERLLLRRLAAFIGGWSLTAVGAVCADEGLPSDTILDVLSSLVDKSLVVVDQHPREARYRLLETVREYALELLAASGETAALADRHLEYFVEMSERAAQELHTPRVHEWMEALDRDSANLAAAIDYSVEHHPSDGLRLTGALGAWWRLRGQLRAGQGALTRSLDAADPEPSPLRAWVLWNCSFLARFVGDVEIARRYSGAALEMAESLGDDEALAGSLYSAASLRIMGAPLESQPMFERALEHARRTGDPWLTMIVLVNISRCYLLTDNFPAAERVLAEGDAVSRRVGGEAVAQFGSSAAWCAMARGQFDRSAAICARTVSAAVELGDPVSHALADMVAAWVELMQGRAEVALERMRACEARVTAKGAFIAIPTTRIELARALAALGRTDEARELLEGVVASGADAGWHYGRALLALSDVLRTSGHAERSMARATEALEVAARLGIRTMAATARELLARLRIADGEWSEAERLLHDSLAQRLDTGSPIWTPQLLDGFALVAAGLESHGEAARLLGAAERGRRDLGEVRWPLDAPVVGELERMLHGQLGDEAFASAHAQGLAMTTDEAVAWVRRARGTRKRPTGGWESLTPTELQVVDLVAQGMTNPQAAARMFISSGTVKVHLGHIFEKLDVRSRSELAALAVRRTH